MSVQPREIVAASHAPQVDEILGALAEPILALDLDGRVSYANTAACQLLAGGSGSLSGMPVSTLPGLKSQPALRARLAEAPSGGAIVVTAELAAGWFEIRSHPHAAGCTLFFRAVSERREAHRLRMADRRAEDAAQSINQRIFDTSLDLILVVDRKGDLIRVSPSSMAILGYRPEEMAGRSAAEFLYAADLDGTRAEMRLARNGRRMRTFDCRYVHKDRRVVPLSWTGVWSEADQQHFFIGRDMTERVAVEERLRHSQRMESIGQLTGGIAHDFNNLLAIMVGNVELVLDGPGKEETAEYCRAALHAAQRGAELTRRLLAFARQQPLQPSVVEAGELIGNLTRLLSRTLGQHIDVAFDGATGLWPIFIDAANLESAITNLAVNARDAMPDGGRLLIQVSNATLDEDYVRANPDATAGDYVLVTVADTGSGMPQEVLNRIFEPFFTTKEVGRGTGLGLSMVFGFIRQSGGHIKVYSEVGHGTSMRLYLPRSKTAAQADAAPDAGARQAGPAGQERILVVEDNDAIRQLALGQLARLGYLALEADGGAAALAVLKSDAPIDLLFTDVVMPGGISGHALAEEARRLRPGLKVLFTSGFPGALLIDAQGGRMIGKPYRMQELAVRIREALDAESPTRASRSASEA